ncbi:antibiotic biosynthesis monooxygenase family protein [Chloroflexota bacterium]
MPKEVMMIRSIARFQLKDAKDLEYFIGIIQKLRDEVMQLTGYITGETMVNAENKCDVLVINTWHSLKNWQDWITSETRLNITKQFESLLSKQHALLTYQYYLKPEKRRQ